MSRQTKIPPLYLSLPHACNYLPDREATTLLIEPKKIIDQHTYEFLLERGFRRSGNLIYRPHCLHCQACIPARIPVEEFTPSRSQKRAWKKNTDLIINQIEAEHTQEYFTLYQKYQNSRHPGGGMDNPKPEQFNEFLFNNHVPTYFHEMRLKENNQLLCVAVTDHLDKSLSATYTFYDPDFPQRSLGIYAILRQIHLAKNLGLKWLYLGYWIKDCDKMAYKSEFRPLEIYHRERWMLQKNGDK